MEVYLIRKRFTSDESDYVGGKAYINEQTALRVCSELYKEYEDKYEVVKRCGNVKNNLVHMHNGSIYDLVQDVAP